MDLKLFHVRDPETGVRMCQHIDKSLSQGPLFIFFFLFDTHDQTSQTLSYHVPYAWCCSQNNVLAFLLQE